MKLALYLLALSYSAAQNRRAIANEPDANIVNKGQSPVGHSNWPGILLAALGVLIAAAAAFLLSRKSEK